MRNREIVIVWAGKILDDNERQWMGFRAIHLTGPLKNTKRFTYFGKKYCQNGKNTRQKEENLCAVAVLLGTCCVLVNALNLSVLSYSSVIFIHEYCRDGNEISSFKAVHLGNFICSNIMNNNTSMRD